MERIGHFEKREDERSQIVAVGTLACPECSHAGAVRDFLSLAPPTRPARVAVRVSLPRVARA
jgi:hypothetical protein